MSSLNGSLEYSSRTESVPVDAATSYTGTSEAVTSAGGGAPYDPYDDDDERQQRGQDASTGYEEGDGSREGRTRGASGPTAQTPIGGALSRGGKRPGSLQRSRGGSSFTSQDGHTGISEAYDNSGYGSRSEATSASFYGEYSSGYDAGSTSYGYGYGDSTIRSPLSGSELSSTFASFYYDNAFMVRMRRTLSFLRRPIYFFLFTIAGSGAIGGICRAVRVMTACAAEGGTETAAALSAAAPSGLRSGYPNVPAWLSEVRASLPAVVEAPARWTLARHGVPVLSDLQRASASAVRAVVRSATETWRVSGPMIPAAVFLPLLTVSALQIASKVMSRRSYGDAADYDGFGSVSNYGEDATTRSVGSPDARVREGGRQRVGPAGSGTVTSASPLRTTSVDSHVLGSTIPTALSNGAPGVAAREWEWAGGSREEGASGKKSSGGGGAPVGKGEPAKPVEVPAVAGLTSVAGARAAGGSGEEQEEEEGRGDSGARSRSRSRSRTQAPATARAPITDARPPSSASDPDADSAGAMGLSPVLPTDAAGSFSPAPALPSPTRDSH